MGRRSNAAILAEREALAVRASAGKGLAGLKARARKAAEALGHNVPYIRTEDAERGRYLGRCDLCLTAAVTLRLNDPLPSKITGDFFGGSAARTECKG
jgi:hypothetical protein